MLQVSLSTVRRRILQYGLEQMTEYTDLTDNELDEITAEFVHNSPNGGQKSYEGYLRMGIHVRRSCIRSTLLRVDPAGVRRRFRQALHRREYSVPMPNSLWHIDGHHKLIRWRIVMHGGIDGFSRLPVFLKVSRVSLAATEDGTRWSPVPLRHTIFTVQLWSLAFPFPLPLPLCVEEPALCNE